MGELPFEKIKREVLIKKSSKPSDYGINPSERSINRLMQLGVIPLDKPSGPSSHEVTEFVKRILNIKKAGHSGTLDPKVTGVLPICLNDACKIMPALISSGKEYVCLMHVHKEVSEVEIKKMLSLFEGKIAQMPPVKSAIKRQLRNRVVYYNEFLEKEGRDVLFITGCEAGFYMRKLCHDIGERLGTGAHMAELRRTKAGPFKEKDLIKIEDLKMAYSAFKEKGDESYLRKCILPVEASVSYLPKVWVLSQESISLSIEESLKRIL